MRTLLVSLLLLAATDARVKIDVNPKVLMKGGTFRLTCRVPRDAQNRRLAWGVVDVRESERDLDGLNALVTWQTFVEHVPCEAGPAYCAVQTNDGRWARVEARFNVAGCDEPGR